MASKTAKLMVLISIAGAFALIISGTALLSVAQFPSKLQDVQMNECTSTAEGEPGRYCKPMQAVANNVNGDTKISAEGITTSEKAASSAEVKMYIELGAHAGCSRSSSGTIDIWNYASNSWESIFSDSVSGGVKSWEADVGETLPRTNNPIASYPSSSTYSNDDGAKTISTYHRFLANGDYFGSDKRTMKYRWSLSAQGYCDRSPAYATLHSIHPVYKFEDGSTGDNINPDPVTDPETGDSINDPADPSSPVNGVQDAVKESTGISLTTPLMILALSGLIFTIGLPFVIGNPFRRK